MKNLKKEEMKKIRGGTNFTATMLNAVVRAVSVMFSIGQAVGSAIKRTINGSYC